MLEPKVERSCPAWSNTKSRFRRSGVGSVTPSASSRRTPRTTRLGLADFPEAVLACDQPIRVESPDVAAAHIDADALDGGAADRPLRHAAVAAREVVAVAVMHVRDPLEARAEASANLLLADEAATPSIRPPRSLEDGL